MIIVEELRKRKKYAVLLILFWIFLFVCSLIAKGIYAAGLPQVETVSPVRRTIGQRFCLNGSIIQGEESAQYTLSGVRVEKVFARVGDIVHVGDKLFQIDLEDMKELMVKKGVEIKQLELQIRDMACKDDLDEQRKELRQQRAGEDYEITYEDGVRQVRNAALDLEDAQIQLEEHMAKKPVKHTDTVSGPKPISEEDMALYEQELEAWEGTRRQLEEKIKNLTVVKEDVESIQNNALLNALRAMEDADFPSDTDSALEIYRMNLEVLQKDYEKYQQIMESGGEVVSEADGVVTVFNASVGERIMDETVVKIADTTGNFLFKTTIDQEIKSYINQGDEGTIEWGRSGNSNSIIINYLTENVHTPEKYDVMAAISGENIVIGDSGVLIIKKQSEVFPCCVPLEALYKGSDDIPYVYVLNKKEGILGMQYMVNEVKVKVLDKNDTYAAIESVLLTEGAEIVVSHTSEIRDGAVVRYKEW